MGESARPRRDLVVIGGSAGALEPLQEIVKDLPPGLPASIVVVLHVAATARSALAAILNRIGGMTVVTPRDGDALQPGYIYVARPDHHLAIRDGALEVTRGPKVNGVRPAVDVLFRSAAESHGRRVTGVVLSGGLDDGSAGLAAIRAAGGVGIVQAPDDAIVDSMPRNAIAVAGAEHVLPVERIGPMIVHEVHVDGEARKNHEPGGGGVEMDPVGANDTPGQVTGITCPECHGSIWLQSVEGGGIMLTCRIGHSFSPDTFYESQAQNIDDALWAGVRSLEEQASLAQAMAARSAKFDDEEARIRFERRSRLATESAERLRKLVVERSEA